MKSIFFTLLVVNLSFLLPTTIHAQSAYQIRPSASSVSTMIINSERGDRVTFRTYSGTIFKTITLVEDKQKISVNGFPQGLYFVSINGTTFRFVRY